MPASFFTTAEAVAVGAVGIDPVGAVLGTSVYWVALGSVGLPRAGGMRTLGRRLRLFPRLSFGVAGNLERALRRARTRALSRLRAQTAALGGHGVVGVRLDVRRFPWAAQCWELQARGTAVRVPPHLAPGGEPFLCSLDGQDLARLARGGWAPVDVVLGIGCVGAGTSADSGVSWLTQRGNVEFPGLTGAALGARARARDNLTAETKARHASGCILSSTQVRTRGTPVGAYGNAYSSICQAIMVGTAIRAVPSHPAGARPAPTLPILRLDRPGDADFSAHAPLIRSSKGAPS